MLHDLLVELQGFPAGQDDSGANHRETKFVVPLRLNLGGRSLNLIGTTMVFGAPLDVTLSELALETFFPADAESAALLASLSGART